MAGPDHLYASQPIPSSHAGFLGSPVCPVIPVPAARPSRTYNCEHLDAVASGFILDVSDPAILDNVYPVPALRDNVVDYMRKQDLSVFHEPRSRREGRNVMGIAPPDDHSTCRAAIRAVHPLASGCLDVLIVDSIGIVNGLARTLPILA
jgi:hypothetical protein